MAEEFGGRARFVSENYGDSELAKRFGVTRYPAIFVDDVLVATPDDFGFYGKGEAEEGGRYAPLKSAASHERFRADLSRMIALILAGRKDVARAEAAPAKSQAIADFVLPKYFAALEPPEPAAKAPEPRATVTLVRWPYT